LQRLGVDDFKQIEARKRYLLERAAKLMGRDQLAQRLGIPSAVFEDWIRGDATMPDGKLMELARVLDMVSREQSNHEEKKGGDG
jgi:ribosome-binding protein aMBF1 (putative translation factor)